MPLFDSSFENNKSGSFHFLDFCLFLISNSICLDCADAQPTVRISCPRVCTLDVKLGVADILSDIQLAFLQMLSSKPMSNHTLLTPPPPHPTTFPLLCRSLSNGTKSSDKERGRGREKRKLACAPCLATTTTIQHLASASPSASATSHVEPRLPANLDCC